MAKVNKSTDSSSLAEVVDRILDKGIVIDAWSKFHSLALNCSRWKRVLLSPRWKRI